jgi:mRNA interferase MazF
LVKRGQVFWLELEHAGTRPVVVLTRDEAIPALKNVVVATVTRTVRGIPTEVPLGPDDGLPVESVVSLDNLETVPKVLLTERIATLGAPKLAELCAALVRATGC